MIVLKERGNDREEEDRGKQRKREGEGEDGIAVDVQRNERAVDHICWEYRWPRAGDSCEETRLYSDSNQ